MTNDELKDALLSKKPVRYNGIVYSHVHEIKYQNPSGKIVVSAGLMDKNQNCIVYAPVKKVENCGE